MCLFEMCFTEKEGGKKICFLVFAKRYAETENNRFHTEALLWKLKRSPVVVTVNHSLRSIVNFARTQVQRDNRTQGLPERGAVLERERQMHCQIIWYLRLLIR